MLKIEKLISLGSFIGMSSGMYEEEILSDGFLQMLYGLLRTESLLEDAILSLVVLLSQLIVNTKQKMKIVFLKYVDHIDK